MSDQLQSVILDVIKAVAKSASLGIVGYILLAITSLGLFIFGSWIKKQEIDAAKKASDAQAIEDQVKNKIGNQDASSNWDDAHGKIGDVRNDNPDTGKKPRDLNGSG